MQNLVNSAAMREHANRSAADYHIHCTNPPAPEILAPLHRLHTFDHVRKIGPSSPPLRGSLLVAHPQLRDPNFRKTVLFISAHDSEEGSFGLITNRPTNKTVAEFLPNQDLGGVGGVPVFIGGPVGSDQLTFASFRWVREARAIECQSHLDIEQAQNLVDEESAVIRAYVGYAGWSAGQLEAELALKSWVVRPPTLDLLDPGKLEGLWAAIMRDLGPWFRLLAEAPDDPSLN